MTGMTRGRLPARVYWVRRLMVLAMATLLVVGIARLLGGSSDGSSGPDRAAQVADTSSSSTTPSTTGPATGSTKGSTTGPTTPTHTPGEHGKTKQPTTDPSPVVLPSGPCAADDIAITPSVPHPIAGRDITLVLDLSTLTTPACTWTMSSSTLALKITSGPDLIWTSVQCGGAIPKHDLVLRQGASVRVPVTWSARRSEPGCPRLTAWALPGTYHLHVAALAGQPQDLTFLLEAPTPAEVTRTAQPHQHHPKAG
jgi:hypothetical protein